MSEFDARARQWDKDKMHIDRGAAIAARLEEMIPLDHSMKVLEYGAGTGILSFLLKDRFSDITLMDNSQEMIKVCSEKAEHYKARHIHPLWMNLEKEDFDGKFDLIYNQMVLHHVNDYEALIHRFSTMLNPGGYLAIADLYKEDGSFHGPDVTVHLGFDPEKLSEIFSNNDFTHISYQTCFEVKRESGKSYPVFLLVGQK
ncbi:MAG TPA: methyltransferase [Prolixibacteraceae bacterium]|nr:methyltransferase [Prolixibacteraceae bacterium]